MALVVAIPLPYYHYPLARREHAVVCRSLLNLYIYWRPRRNQNFNQNPRRKKDPTKAEAQLPNPAGATYGLLDCCRTRKAAYDIDWMCLGRLCLQVQARGNGEEDKLTKDEDTGIGILPTNSLTGGGAAAVAGIGALPGCLLMSLVGRIAWLGIHVWPGNEEQGPPLHSASIFFFLPDCPSRRLKYSKHRLDQSLEMNRRQDGDKSGRERVRKWKGQ